MKTFRGDLFDQKTNCADAIIIPTNGATKKSGEAVMGKGVAKTVSELTPLVPKRLGEKLLQGGNHVYDLEMSYNCAALVSFPVKPKCVICKASKLNLVEHMRKHFSPGDIVPGWAAAADINIIRQSLQELKNLVDKKNWKRVVLPLVGCGAGELKESDILPLLKQELDDRFVLILR